MRREICEGKKRGPHGLKKKRDRHDSPEATGHGHAEKGIWGRGEEVPAKIA